MKNKKMIVVDLDGTLLDINKGCSIKTKKYLKRLKDLGYIIVIATGRVLRSAVAVTGGAEFADYVIASAGAVVYDKNNARVVMKKNIDIDIVRDICSCYNDDMKSINVCDLFYHHKYMDSQNYNVMFERRISNIDRLLRDTDGIVNITIHVKDNKLVDKYYKMFDMKDLELLIMQDSFGKEKSLEIFSRGVSKYEAIKVVMKRENIANDDVIAFGDGLNDINMLKLSGIGVAMGNALDCVKDVSDYVTISHNSDGVVYFLKKYLKENNLLS